MAGGWRVGVRRRTAGLAVRLARVPRLVVGLAALALLLGGLLAPGAVGAVLLALLAAVLGWLLALAWEEHPPAARAARVAAVALLCAVAVGRVL